VRLWFWAPPQPESSFQNWATERRGRTNCVHPKRAEAIWFTGANRYGRTSQRGNRNDCVCVTLTIMPVNEPDDTPLA